jgi:hypothetical protein
MFLPEETNVNGQYIVFACAASDTLVYRGEVIGVYAAASAAASWSPPVELAFATALATSSAFATSTASGFAGGVLGASSLSFAGGVITTGADGGLGKTGGVFIWARKASI